MFLLISFGPKARREFGFQPRKRKPVKFGAVRPLEREKLKAQIKRARAKFRGRYNDLLLYMNKIAIVATLESIGVPKTRQSKRLIEQALTSATSDFKNLISAGEKLTPKYKVELFDILGPEMAKKFLQKLPGLRTMIFSIEDELVKEEKKGI